MSASIITVSSGPVHKWGKYALFVETEMVAVGIEMEVVSMGLQQIV
jgi:hypothetical protein